MITGRFERGGRLELSGEGDERVRWDPAKRSGELVRDRGGRQGLFVCERGDTLLFAGEIRDLLEMLPGRPAPDPVAVAHFVSNTGIPSPRTLYSGIESVAPGERIRLSPEGWKRERWWWPEPSGGAGGGSPEEQLLGLMDEAVQRAWPDAGNAAVLLSGGFDSGAVAVLAARQAREAGRTPPPAYSSLFPEHPEVDEAARIAATRSSAGLEGVEQRYVSGPSAVSAAVEFIEAWELPPVSPNGFIWRPLIRRAAANGIDTVVDGEGGDEVFGCSPYLIADALRRGRVLHARSLASRITGMGDEPKARWIRQALRVYGLRGALPHGLHRALRRARGSGDRSSPLLREPFARMHRESDDPWAWKQAPGQRWRARLSHLAVVGAEALGAGDYFRREAALCGVSFRQPFRDPDLLEAVLGLDPALMFDPHLDRPLARRALAGLLPDAVRLNDRKPHFNALLDEALCGADSEPLRRLLGPDALCREYVELPEGFADLDPSPGPRAGIELFRVAALECWMRRVVGDPVQEFGSGDV